MADELEQKKLRARVLKNQVQFNEKEYEYDDKFTAWDGGDPMGVHTTAELASLLEKDESVDVDAKVITTTGYRRIGKKEFLESFKREDARVVEAARKVGTKLKESIDYFQSDFEMGSSALGEESIPLLGGPFNKQLYYYDYLRMHALAFYAYHHDPVANMVVNLIHNFSMGKGYRVDSENKQALAIWRAFEEINNIPALMDLANKELSIYGENMFWWLPNNETKISYRDYPSQMPSLGLMPRVRLIDPSVIWEIVTYPEDITRVLYYQWVAPTQWQLYTGNDGGKPVPGSKFIVQQILAKDVQHHKVNAVSNEKRGRSDLYPVLGYLKRLRDSVNYNLSALQKQAAWSIDTEIDGNQSDVDNYVAAMEALGTIPPAGSEFAHTTKIKRNYLSNNASGGKGGGSTAFDWCLDMIAMGTGIPMSYFGTHISSAQNRASAFVGTEPVVKKFEMRQKKLKQIIEGMANELMRRMGIEGASFEVTFPELVTQNRSEKLKDLELAVAAGWLSKKRAATIVAKELGIEDYDYDSEQKEINTDPQAPIANPLTTPPASDNPRTDNDERRDAVDSGVA